MTIDKYEGVLSDSQWFGELSDGPTPVARSIGQIASPVLEELEVVLSADKPDPQIENKENK